MSLNTDIFYQHLSATINRVWLYYQHPIKTTPCRNQATTSQTTPIILAINFQYNSTPTTSHISTNPSNIQYHCTTHISFIHITNLNHTVSSTTPKYTLPQCLVWYCFIEWNNMIWVEIYFGSLIIFLEAEMNVRLSTLTLLNSRYMYCKAEVIF